MFNQKKIVSFCLAFMGLVLTVLFPSLVSAEGKCLVDGAAGAQCAGNVESGCTQKINAGNPCKWVVTNGTGNCELDKASAEKICFGMDTVTKCTPSGASSYKDFCEWKTEPKTPPAADTSGGASSGPASGGDTGGTSDCNAVCQWIKEQYKPPTNPDGTKYQGPLPDCAYSGQCRETNDLVEILINQGRAIFGLIGMVALVAFVYGGFLMVFSFGASDKVQQGKDVMVAAVVGIIIVFSAYLIVSFILQALGVSPEFQAIK